MNMKKNLLKLAVLFLAPAVMSLTNTAFAYDSINDYNQAMSQNKTIALEFSNDRCPTCKKAAPVIAGVMPQYASKVKFISLTTDVRDNVKIFYKYHVPAIPTIVLINTRTGATKLVTHNVCVRADSLRMELDNFLRTNPQ